MTNQEAIEILEIFNENADKLKNSRFVKWIESNALKVHMPVNPEIVKSNSFPDDEEIDAFVLTFRKFIQNNDNSIRNISKIYNEFPLSQGLKDVFDRSRSNLNGYLDSSCRAKVVGEKDLENMTSRELMDIYIYGFLSHNDPQKYKKYILIEKDELFKDFLWLEFNVILHAVFRAIYYFMHCNKRAIRELQQLNIVSQN